MRLDCQLSEFDRPVRWNESINIVGKAVCLERIHIEEQWLGKQGKVM